MPQERFPDALLTHEALEGLFGSSRVPHRNLKIHSANLQNVDGFDRRLDSIKRLLLPAPCSAGPSLQHGSGDDYEQLGVLSHCTIIDLSRKFQKCFLELSICWRRRSLSEGDTTFIALPNPCHCDAAVLMLNLTWEHCTYGHRGAKGALDSSAHGQIES